MYKIFKTTTHNQEQISIIRNNGNEQYTSFLADPANTDYANFKKEILADEAQLQDAEGVLMTPEQAKAYVATLP